MPVPRAVRARGCSRRSRTTGLLPAHLPFRGRRGPFPRRDWDGERIAFVALTLSAIAFGLQSAIDWTWFVPGPTAMALLSAGYVAGRGTGGGAACAGVRALRPSAAPLPFLEARARGRRSGRGVAAVLVAWAIWQPEASRTRSVQTAIELADQGRYEEAIEQERMTQPTPTRCPPLRSSPARRSRPRRGATAGGRAHPGASGAQVPRRARHLAGAGALPAAHAGPAAAGARDLAWRALPGPVLAAGPARSCCIPRRSARSGAARAPASRARRRRPPRAPPGARARPGAPCAAPSRGRPGPGSDRLRCGAGHARRQAGAPARGPAQLVPRSSNAAASVAGGPPATLYIAPSRPRSSARAVASAASPT